MTVHYSIRFSDGSLGAPTTKEHAESALLRIDPDRRGLCSVVCLQEVTADAPRETVRWFAEQMERKLKRNDHKGHWSNCDVGYLFRRLHEEVTELRQVAERPIVSNPIPGLGDIASEAADVANFAMMIADNARTFLPQDEPAVAPTKRPEPVRQCLTFCRPMLTTSKAFADSIHHRCLRSEGHDGAHWFSKECDHIHGEPRSALPTLDESDQPRGEMPTVREEKSG